MVDRPTQGHRFLSREYVQPQWVFDCANSRCLLAAAPYAPGGPPPPHLSPFVEAGADGGYVPEYAKTIAEVQEAARAVRRRRAAEAVEGGFAGEAAEAGGEGGVEANAAPEEDAEAEAEALYESELAKELQVRENGGAGAARGGSNGGPARGKGRPTCSSSSRYGSLAGGWLGRAAERLSHPSAPMLSASPTRLSPCCAGRCR